MPTKFRRNVWIGRKITNILTQDQISYFLLVKGFDLKTLHMPFPRETVMIFIKMVMILYKLLIIIVLPYVNLIQAAQILKIN